MIKKFLIKKEKRQYFEDLQKSVVISEGKTYFLEDISRDFHASEGTITKEDLQKSAAVVTTNKGKEFFIVDATFIDSYKGIKKLAQTIPLKDIGFIIAETGLDKTWTIVDSGSGSGGSVCFLARFVKKVYTYDVSELNLEQTRKNVEYFGLKNVVIKKQDIYEKIPNKNVDMILLDVPDAAKAINSANAALKVGGFLVAYCPQITQSQLFINGLPSNYSHVKTVEIIERDWKVEGQVVRPRSLSNIHSAFLTIVRKIN